LAGVVLFVFGLFFVVEARVLRSHNSPFNLSGDIGWALLGLTGLGLLFSGLVLSILGLALKEH
jgi:hypothetical protein